VFSRSRVRGIAMATARPWRLGGAFPPLLLLAASLGARLLAPCSAYTVEELKKADHSVGMKLAVEEDDIEVLKGMLTFYLEEQKVDLKDLCSSHSNIFHYADYTPLHYACLLNRDEHIRLLVEAGCPNDLETASGIRPLHAAAKEGSAVSAKVLLQGGADPRQLASERVVHNNDVPQRGHENMNAATLAAQAGHVAVLRALQESGHGPALRERDLNGEVSSSGWAPIHYAASKGHRDAFHFLTFEVGWGSAPAERSEVAAAAPPGSAHRREVEELAALEGAAFEAAKDRHFAEMARRAVGEL